MKKYFVEIFFLASFFLPFIKRTIIHNGLQSVDSITGIELVVKYFYVIIPVIISYIFYLKYKKTYLKYLIVIFYLVFLVLGITLGDIIKVPPKDYYLLFSEILPRIALWGLPINIVLGILVINKFTQNN